MHRTLRMIALPAALAVMLAGCSLPFEIVPKDSGEPSAAETTAEPLPTEEATAEAEIQETTEEQSPEPSEDTDGDGKPNYSVTPSEVFPKIVELCDLPDDVLADDGMTLILDTPGTDEGSGTLTIDQSGCAIGYLNPPDWLMQQIESTKLDGTRETAVDGYLTYSWTVNNEKGLDFVVRVSEEEN